MTEISNMLFVLDRWPYPPRDGETYPIWAHLEHLRKTRKVTVLLVGAGGIGASKSVPAGLEVLRVPRRHTWLPCRIVDELCGRAPAFMVDADVHRLPELSGRSFDMLYVSPFRLSALGAKLAARMRPRPRLVLGLSDSVSRAYANYSRSSFLRGASLSFRVGSLASAFRAVNMALFERRYLLPYDLVLVQSREDARSVVSACGRTFAERVAVVSNGIKASLLDIDYRGAGKNRLLHLGGAASVRGELLTWFIRNVFVHVRRTLSDMTLWVVGRCDDQSRRRLAAFPGVRVLGFVDDLASVLSQCTMTVAPLFQDHGVVNKVLDSMAAGIPCSGIGCFSGLTGFINGVHGFEVRSADEWKEMLVRVLPAHDLLRRVSREARRLVSQRFRWESTLCRLDERLAGILPTEPATPSAGGHARFAAHCGP